MCYPDWKFFFLFQSVIDTTRTSKRSQIEVVEMQQCTYVERRGRPPETCDLNCFSWLWFATKFRSCHVYSIHQSSHSQPQRQFATLILWFCCSSHRLNSLHTPSTHPCLLRISLIDEPFTKLTRRGSWHAEVTHVLFVWMCPALSVLFCCQQSRVWPVETFGTTGQASWLWMTLQGRFQTFEAYFTHKTSICVCRVHHRCSYSTSSKSHLTSKINMKDQDLARGPEQGYEVQPFYNLLKIRQSWVTTRCTRLATISRSMVW